jgi:hypothetical protein
MSEPRRLTQSGGVSKRLLDSASIDKPSQAARQRAASFAATASAFATTSSAAGARPPPRSNVVKTLVTWVCIGAAASGTLALIGSRLFDSAGEPGRAAAPRTSAGVMAELTPAPSAGVAPAGSPDISPEPWVPSPVDAAPSASSGAPRRSSASFDEVREIEAVRAAVSRGDSNAAIATLNNYDQTHPNGELKPESMALRIQVLNSSGKTSEARTLANDFQSKYPQHPLMQQVKRNVPK